MVCVWGCFFNKCYIFRYIIIAVLIYDGYKSRLRKLNRSLKKTAGLCHLFLVGFFLGQIISGAKKIILKVLCKWIVILKNC